MTTGRVMYDGRVFVDYHQIWVQSGGQVLEPGVAFDGQANGLLGAAQAGVLVLITGTAIGDVGLRVVVHDQQPPQVSGWEDVVEASFDPAGPQVTVQGLMSDPVCSFTLPHGTYRVRWSGKGVDDAYDGAVGSDEPLIDSFELAFWPAAAAPDVILCQRSERGREAHLAQTPQGREQIERQFDRPEWGDDPASEVQRRAARSSVDLDREFAERLGAATPEQLRAVRNRVVRFVCADYGIAHLPWVADALASLDAARPLPADFHPGAVYDRLDRELGTQRDERVRGDSAETVVDPGWGLAMILFAAVTEEEPLDAALGAILSAFAGFEHRRNSEVIDQVIAVLGA